MTTYQTIGVALAVVAPYLWRSKREGLFSAETTWRDRWASLVRYLFWLGSIVLVDGPLHKYRQQMGDAEYLVLSLVILALFFVLGIVAAVMITEDEQDAQ